MGQSSKDAGTVSGRDMIVAGKNSEIRRVPSDSEGSEGIPTTSGGAGVSKTDRESVGSEPDRAGCVEKSVRVSF